MLLPLVSRELSLTSLLVLSARKIITLSLLGGKEHVLMQDIATWRVLNVALDKK